MAVGTQRLRKRAREFITRPVMERRVEGHAPQGPRVEQGREASTLAIAPGSGAVEGDSHEESAKLVTDVLQAAARIAAARRGEEGVGAGTVSQETVRTVPTETVPGGRNEVVNLGENVPTDTGTAPRGAEWTTTRGAVQDEDVEMGV